MANQMTNAIGNMTTQMTTQLSSKIDTLTAATQSLSDNIAKLVQLNTEMKESNKQQLDALTTLIDSNNKDLVARIYADFPNLNTTQTDMVSATKAAITNFSALSQLQDNQINLELYQEGVQNGSFYRDVVADHYTNYCDQNSASEKNAFPAGCKVAQDFAHADLKLSSLLTPNTYNSSQQTAAKIFMRNLIKPFSSLEASNLIKNATNVLQSDEEQTASLAKVLVTEAALSAARHSLTTSYANRLSGTDSNNQPTPSVMEIMATEATRRFTDSTWLTNIKTAASSTLLRELAQMQALQIWLEYQRYQQMERVEGLLVGQMSASQFLSEEIKKSSAQADQATQQTTNKASEVEKARQRSKQTQSTN